MAFETAYNQLPGQDPLFGNQDWSLRLKEKDIYGLRKGRREHLGYFDEYNNKILDSDKFTIPERPKPKGEQLGFDFVQRASGQRSDPAFQPTDEVLHHLRQQNPKLNDYQFKLYSSGDEHQVDVSHAPFKTATPEGKRQQKRETEHDVAFLHWDRESPHIPAVRDRERTYGKIGFINVEKAHRGQGVAEAMFDYATGKHDEGYADTAPMHDIERSEAGNVFARRTGGIVPRRQKGQLTKEF